MEDLVLAADLVVVGRITDLRPGREFGDKVDKVHYAAATISVDRLLGGDLPAAGVILEVQLPHGQGAADVRDYAAELPATHVLLFLRNKGVEAASHRMPANVVEREAPFFRLVRPDSMFIEAAGKAIATSGAETSFLQHGSGTDFEALVQRIDAIR